MIAKKRHSAVKADLAFDTLTFFKAITLWQLWVIIFCAILIRICNMVFSIPIADESYYWVWSQHPALSYFDHPLIVAVNAYLIDSLFGPNLLALRATSLITGIATILILRAWCRFIYDEAGDRMFLICFALFVTMPGFNVILSLATPEHLLIFFSVLTSYLFTRVLASYDMERPLPLLALYGGAVSLGFAGLTKYYAGFLGIGLFFALICYRSSRGLLRSPHVWIGGLVTLLMQWPVLVWNMQNDFVSFNFHLVARHKMDFLSRIHFEYLIGFVAQVIVMTSPIAILIFWRLMRHSPNQLNLQSYWQFSRWTLAVSFLVFGTVSLTAPAFGWWVLAAITPTLPLFIAYIGSVRNFWIHIVFGLILNIVHTFSSTIGPVTFLIGLSGNPWAIGYPDQEQLTASLTAHRDYDFIASTGWQDVSMAGFLLGNPNGLALDEDEANGYRIWQDAASHKGQSALVFIRNGRNKTLIAPLFGSFELRDSIVISRFGRKLTRYDIFIGRDFKGSIHQRSHAVQ